DSTSFSSLPTIFDRLSAAGVSHRYYFNNLAYLLLWGFKYLSSSSPFSAFLDAAAGGALPAVSYVDPVFTITDDGTGNDDHPHADIRNGDVFLAAVFHALSSGPAWRNTVLVITFDEWGGFFEHVTPPRVAAANQFDLDQVNGQVLLGFRVPTLIVSPFTRSRTRGLGRTPAVNHALFDHTSILKLIEWRWGLPPLTARDASPQIGNLAEAMDFRYSDSRLPALPNPLPPVNAPGCFQPEIGGSFSEPQKSPWRALARAPGAEEWMRLAGLPRTPAK
ncbi:MAG: Phospholipase, partial [Candidatus Solibacter sp.]|nr:Phospholipase [Candidatus Solibacter sp.]